jgi:hypothetical protein
MNICISAIVVTIIAAVNRGFFSRFSLLGLGK